MAILCFVGIHYTLGNSIFRNHQEGWIILYQAKYKTSKLENFQMSNYNLISTPMQTSVRLSKDDCPSIHDVEQMLFFYPYFQLVGSLMHAIVNSRPDCAYVVNSLTQYLSNLNEPHI